MEHYENEYKSLIQIRSIHVRIAKMYLIDGTYTKIGGTEAWI
jgi:hypothetical protein